MVTLLFPKRRRRAAPKPGPPSGTVGVDAPADLLGVSCKKWTSAAEPTNPAKAAGEVTLRTPVYLLGQSPLDGLLVSRRMRTLAPSKQRTSGYTI